MTLDTNDIAIDLLGMAGYAHGQPIEQMLWLQEHDPVHWHPEPFDGPGFWALTRYADIKFVEGNPGAFSNQPSTTVVDRDPSDDDHRMLLFQDPPRHGEHRAFLAPELSPLAVRASEDHVQLVVDEIIDEVIERGECDLVTDISGKLASYIMSDLLGLPREQGLALYHASEVSNNAGRMDEGEAVEATATLFSNAQQVFADRTSAPRNDMVSRLANGQLYGGPVDLMHFAVDFLLLVAAGGDTTRNVVSGGMQALFEHPDQRARLAADLSLMPSAVEEILRWVTPIVYQRHTATRDIEISGVPIRAGQKVLGFYGAANRDPRQFEDPLTFDVGRRRNAHLAFGAGSHFCLGSHLARLELGTMFRAILTRLPDIELAGPVEWLRNNEPIAPVVVGPKSMPVRFTPGRRLR
jgi:cytochrome P450